MASTAVSSPAPSRLPIWLRQIPAHTSRMAVNTAGRCQPLLWRSRSKDAKSRKLFSSI